MNCVATENNVWASVILQKTSSVGRSEAERSKMWSCGARHFSAVMLPWIGWPITDINMWFCLARTAYSFQLPVKTLFSPFHTQSMRFFTIVLTHMLDFIQALRTQPSFPSPNPAKKRILPNQLQWPPLER